MDTEAALGAEEATLTIVRVEAGSVVVEADGANYAPLVKRESKKERRARQQEDAREQQKAAATASPTTADGGGDGGTDAGVEAPTEAGVAEGEVEGAEPWLAVANMYVYMPDCDAYNFVTNNSAFVLTLIGLVWAGFSGLHTVRARSVA